MILHTVELKNWRQHTKTKIDFDDEVTVVYGPNERGKSKVFEALYRGFFDKSTTRSDAIKKIMPLSASGKVQSTVKIEFTVNQKRYLVEKNFNFKAGTLLYKLDNGRPILLNEETADKELSQLLEADLPSKGVSNPSHWGASQWLWSPQENNDLPSDKGGDPTSALHLDNDGNEKPFITPKFQVIQDRINPFYSQYFTKKGKASSNSPILEIKKEIQDLQQNKEELEQIIKSNDDKRRDLEELERELPLLKKSITETKEQLKNARSEAIDFSSIEAELKVSNAAIKEEKRKISDVEGALMELNNSANEIENLQKEEKQSIDNLSRLEAVCDQLNKNKQEMNKEVDDKAMNIRKCENLATDARILWRKSVTMNEINSLSKKYERIIDIDDEIEDLRKQERPVCPSNEEIAEIIQNQTKIEGLKENLKVRGLRVKVQPGEKGSLQVEVDGTKLNDQTLKATGTENVVVKAPELGNVTIDANLEQASDSKIEIGLLKERIKGSLRKYTVDSIKELRELYQIQNNVKQNINELLAERKGLDERNSDEIFQELDKLKEKYKEYDNMERTPLAEKMNKSGGNFVKLMKKREDEEEEARKLLDNSRIERDQIKEDLSRMNEELAGVKVEKNRFSEDLVKAKNQERELIRKYGSVEFQEEILNTAKANRDQLKNENDEIKQYFHELEKGPLNKIKRLGNELEGHEQVVRQHQTAIDNLKGSINIKGLEGAYSKLSGAESRIEILRDKLYKEQIRADSYKLLKDTLNEQHFLVLSSVIGPIKDEVKNSLNYVTGSLHNDIEMNQYLFPTKFGEEGFENGKSLKFDEGSSGLKEVLALCVRLAVAKHLSGRDCQCLLLDDPFVHVSSDRLNRMIELFNEAVDEYDLQIIVFTHRPKELSGFGGKMVHIDSVKNYSKN